MKTILLIAFTMLCANSYSQEITSLMKGTYKATCLMERCSTGSVCLSDFCEVKTVGNSAEAVPLTLSFDGNTMKVMHTDLRIELVPIKLIKGTDEIEFNFGKKKETYLFKVVIAENGDFILRDKTGLLVYLKKI